ncbi:MAG: hypothetical protein R6X34_25275, partial [Chloroflexota bacterium]
MFGPRQACRGDYFRPPLSAQKPNAIATTDTAYWAGGVRSAAYTADWPRWVGATAYAADWPRWIG